MIYYVCCYKEKQKDFEVLISIQEHLKKLKECEISSLLVPFKYYDKYFYSGCFRDYNHFEKLLFNTIKNNINKSKYKSKYNPKEISNLFTFPVNPVFDEDNIKYSYDINTICRIKFKSAYILGPIKKYVLDRENIEYKKRFESMKKMGLEDNEEFMCFSPEIFLTETEDVT